MTEKEMHDIAKAHSAAINDHAIQIAHCVDRAKWDRLAQCLTLLSHKVNVLAGMISQHLPKTKSQD